MKYSLKIRFFFVKLILKLFSQNYVIFKFKETKIILLIVNFVNWIPFLLRRKKNAIFIDLVLNGKN